MLKPPGIFPPTIRDTRPEVCSPRASECSTPSAEPSSSSGNSSFLKRRRELHLKVAQNLVLESRLAPDEVFDGFQDRHFFDLLLQLLGDNEIQDVVGLYRDVFNAHGRTGWTRGGSRGSDGLRLHRRYWGGTVGGRFGSNSHHFILKLVINLLAVLRMTENDA